MRGVEQSADYHPEGDVWSHTLLLLDQLPAGAPPTLALGALLHDVAKPLRAGRNGDRITFYGHETVGADLAVAICQRLRRSRETWEQVDYLVRNHLRFLNARRCGSRRSRRCWRADGFDELARLARLDALASNHDLRFVLFCERRTAELGGEALRPPRLLGGADLIAMGYSPGPRVGEILRCARRTRSSRARSRRGTLPRRSCASASRSGREASPQRPAAARRYSTSSRTP